jgi:eukaryotic-like serine/threonine-protein kinase
VTSTTSPTERVGRYQLLEPIGVGPSGAVSRAKVFGVAGFERQFAVKRFHAELTATAAMAAMMSAAARAYGSLEHPRIARMSEFGVAQGSTFTAVEYVQGLDALRLISEARLAGVTLAVGGALALVSQAARAVGYAHGRGLTHLGLAPTNVIVTAEGDIKITDFGILSATLPQRPIETPRLAQRIPYLAPEQLANEATSAATDVFALGVLAYELITGTRTFKGDSPQQVAAAIMAGPPAEPALPRPIVRVLSRCLARSPFERFPDARALADALDAALRVAPVPGTRKDIGAQVKETLDRLAALNEGQMSGMVALHLGTGPVRRLDDDAPRRTPAQGRQVAPAHPPGGPVTVAGGPVTVGGPVPTGGGPVTIGGPLPSSGGPVTVGGPLPSSGGPVTIGGPVPTGGGPATVGGPLPSSHVPAGPATTVQDLPRYPITTVPGLAPPPIPVPAGVAPPATPPPPSPLGTSTLIGMGKTPAPGVPVIKPGSVGGLPSARPPAVPAAAKRAPTRPGTDLSVPVELLPAASGADIPVETLDPDDLMPIDSGVVNVVELDALADDPSGPSGGPSSTDDDDESSSQVAVTASLRSARPADRSSVGPRASDPGSPGSPLFDPVAPSARRSEPRVSPDAVSGAKAAGSDERGAQETDPGGTGSIAEPETLELTDDAGTSGQTMLGFTAPQPHAAASLPHEPSSADAPDREPTDVDAGATREGFRRAGTPAPAAAPHEDSPPPAPPVPPRAATTPPPMPPGWVTTPPLSTSTPGTSGEAPPRRRARWIVIGMIGVAIAGVGAWQAYLRLVAPAIAPEVGSAKIVPTASDARVAAAPADAAQVAVTPAADATGVATSTDAAQIATTPPTDAAQVAVAPPADVAQVAATPPADAGKLAALPDATRVATAGSDAGTPPSDAKLAPGDAGQTTAVTTAVPTAPGDSLSIVSTPPGARVFLDGADTGATPVKLPGSPDRHTIALLLAGHELYVAQVDGHGAFQIPLKEVTPPNGPAGIKVLRCKDKDRYYVFVDGKPTGQTCPTERIGCEVGPHTVEVYDVVSETRRKWDIEVKDTRLSFRVRVE